MNKLFWDILELINISKDLKNLFRICFCPRNNLLKHIQCVVILQVATRRRSYTLQKLDDEKKISIMLY